MAAPSPLEAALEALELGSRFSRVMAAQFATKALRGATLEEAAGDEGHPFRRVAAYLLETATAAAAHAGTADASTRRCHTASARAPPSPWQRGCPDIVPHLTARPVWADGAPSAPDGACPPPPLPPPLAAFLQTLREAAPAIRAEVLALRGGGGGAAFREYRAPTFTEAPPPGAGDAPGAAPSAPHPPPPAGPLGAPGTDAGTWNVLYLQLHNAAEEAGCAANCAALPATAAALRAAPRPYGHALLSAMAPATHIAAHTGPTNRKLRVHLPLLVPPGGACRLRVGPSLLTLAEGAPFVFDDSLQHEAANGDGHGSRITLIVDVWHPDLSEEEVKFLAFARGAQMRRAKALSAAGALPAGSDFFAVLRDAGARGAREADVFAGVDGTAPRQDAQPAAPLPFAADLTQPLAEVACRDD
jgi:aspartate beta-hydroxylase